MINTVSLTGRLTNDINVRETKNSQVGNFTIAVQRNFGEKEADFIQVTVFNKVAENMKKFTSKGDLVGVVGRLQTSNYEKDGQTIYVTQVVSNDITFLETKNSKDTTSEEVTEESPTNETEKIEITDEPLPF